MAINGLNGIRLRQTRIYREKLDSNVTEISLKLENGLSFNYVYISYKYIKGIPTSKHVVKYISIH